MCECVGSVFFLCVFYFVFMFAAPYNIPWGMGTGCHGSGSNVALTAVIFVFVCVLASVCVCVCARAHSEARQGQRALVVLQPSEV